MAYDEDLADRVAQLLAVRDDVGERRMFGGIAWMVGDHMACGVGGDRLFVRLVRDAYESALDEPHVEPMRMGRRTMRAYVEVAPAGVAGDAALERWVAAGVRTATVLPPKP